MRQQNAPGPEESGTGALLLAGLVLLVGVVVGRADRGVLAGLDRLVPVGAVAVAVTVAVGGLHGLGEGLVGVRPGPAKRAAGGRGGHAVGVLLGRRRQGLEDLLGVHDRALLLG